MSDITLNALKAWLAALDQPDHTDDQLDRELRALVEGGAE